ncbi:MAG: hypothetical protein MUF01_12020 [Bryobacterales bacterium]|jgi:ABC-type transport system involved in multi-copper enzyme maturation permease subunit|nr:hypothetical protein [Bryobacterales bacterium]
MSTTPAPHALPATGQPAPSRYAIYLQQLLLLVRMDLAYHFFTTRALWLYLLAAAPVAITAIYAFVQLAYGPKGSFSNDILVYGNMMEFLYLRFLVFFGCLAVGTFLVRGEVLNRTLHYYFLLPIRREVFLVSRFLIGFLATTVVFSLSLTAAYFLTMAHRGDAFWSYFWQGQGLANLLDYLLMTALACAGYGAVFLLASLYVRNPLIPGAVVFVWEVVHVFLPAVLQRFSITHYLKSLSPVDIPVEGLAALFLVPPEPVARIWAVLGILLLTAGALTLAALRVRRTEIDYSS